MEDLIWWVIEQKRHPDILKELKANSASKPWVNYFLNDYPMNPANLNSVCRIGFVPYNMIIQDRYFYVDRSRDPEILAGGGIATQIYWDYDPANLPAGWQGTVRQSYLDASTKGLTPNTQVALLAFTLPRFRNKGISGIVLSKMCRTAQKRGYRHILVPALPPTQFQKEYVRTSMDEIANLKRDDGEDYDYWIRLHKKKGATVIGTCAHSHRFIFSLEDFSSYVSSDPIEKTGEHVVRMDKDHVLGPNKKNMWQMVYADIERSFVTFNWGCIWVQYNLEKLDFRSIE